LHREEPGFIEPQRRRGVCYAFQRNECHRGDSCSFEHSISDVPQGHHERGGRSGSNLCYAYQRGECRNDPCRFVHELSGSGMDN